MNKNKKICTQAEKRNRLPTSFPAEVHYDTRAVQETYASTQAALAAASRSLPAIGAEAGWETFRAADGDDATWWGSE